MTRDLLLVAAAIGAGFNALLSVIYNVYKPESPLWKAAYVATMSFLFAVALVGSVGGIFKDSWDRAAKRETLSVLLQGGQSLFDRCNDPSTAPSADEIQEWANGAENALLKLGSFYVNRFRSDIGAGPQVVSGNPCGRALFRLYAQLYRLHEFAAEAR